MTVSYNLNYAEFN